MVVVVRQGPCGYVRGVGFTSKQTIMEHIDIVVVKCNGVTSPILELWSLPTLRRRECSRTLAYA